MRPWILLLWLYGVNMVLGERMDAFSFRPPFDKVDKEGKRVINDTWIYGGSTDPKKHFIRLTTDRQSKRGFIWSRDVIGRDTLSFILSFRISGVGKRWFGDGIGLWLTEHANYVQGVNHGFTDQFKGIGIVIDTFNNPEHKGGHKDISLQVNDGTKTIDELTAEKRIGCDAAVRFHEKNASFDPVHSISRVKVKLQAKKVVIEVDAENNGRWIACTSMDLPFSNAAWLQSATLGITGATGALADNHDVISLETFTEFTDAAISDADSKVILHTISKDYKKWMNDPNCGVECLLAIIQKELANFKIEAEHSFTDLKEKTENNVAKLKKQEKEIEERVVDIERRLAINIDISLDLKKQGLGQEVKEKITKQVDKAKVSSGWKMPFFLLFVGLSAGGAFVYRKYQELMKSHLL